MNQPAVKADLDPQETAEWLEAFEGVTDIDGRERAHFLLERMAEADQRKHGDFFSMVTTPYVNTIPAYKQPTYPGDLAAEARINAFIRWNAMAMVLRAGKHSNVGGHIATYQSAAVLYDVGFTHFFRGRTDDFAGDMVYIQGHSAPGIYGRAYLEGRIDEELLDNFRRESARRGLSSYPHPRLMPDFWQYPTVSMGLGPLTAAYQARYMRYLEYRELKPHQGRKVWAFLGDGEMDQPESLAAIALGGREKLDNLIFVVNCNLQRLDGPVRGNGKIIQELEGTFKAAGWQVIKVIWGSGWDKLLQKDRSGLLMQRMMECVDGDYQTFKSQSGAYVREHFFGKYPELLELVADLSDDEIWALHRGGHDPQKVYAAYHQAVHTPGRPTVVLAKTVKGFGMGEAGEGQNINHQLKKMSQDAVKAFRDRLGLTISDAQLAEIPYLKPEPDSAAAKYITATRTALGGYIPARFGQSAPLAIPELSRFDGLLKGSGERNMSTTMAFVNILGTLLKDVNIGKLIVPIVPDESRTFGMEGLFRQIGIHSWLGQLYTPQDAGQLSYYKEAKDGQILQEGINESGAISTWIAAGTAYSNHDVATIPFYIFYSMFGLQRVGDLAWAAADARTKGFLLGATSGRTTLMGEGLQHDDGHSHVLSSVIPSCVSYDPTYAYELAVIVQSGMRRMFVEQEDIYYYITLLNEGYPQPPMPAGVEDGIIQGAYLLKQSETTNQESPRAQLVASGAIMREALAAAELLAADFGVASDIWSATSLSELRRNGMAAERWNLLHPEDPPKVPYIQSLLAAHPGPVVVVTDYMKIVGDQIKPFLPDRTFIALGTDGFGRSDTREALREFFEVNRHFIALAALKLLADEGRIARSEVNRAMALYGIAPDKPDPAAVK
ncbi:MULTISPECIES: pyruvate dehydrogenase (acetyl-transferring), homodimeric type [Serratia]|jgi:pyruvate dehydrogenase E1 component|uniref:Pyruvate dehydrogenase E1 component n=3 Tax=Serratia TaxID=613 RepID=A0AAW6X264_9GAMM|nr:MULTISPECIES: pyruvate dehydrogenase (acetyl-transferring), homodimeric type [Serratia]ASL83552.1 pyruvate dehydrogenase (acetyl-transferring), homodimeric type [Serratia marcescens]ASM31805.1 pyruvate dehydrogenase (acetyl-transferring), homodimeric type [Serratia marcescens]AVU36041.1 pyruvate dehydrogenase (acetyl-transferring), homodimeric type [Serratia marcescens]AVU41143.1 pyruvate dehydrogenase (acetyl-transferring), homodimeric type [Serratia marcescens]EGT0501465.1 pyruvate dehydr